MTAEVASELDRWNDPYLRELEAQRTEDAVIIERLRGDMQRGRNEAEMLPILVRVARVLSPTECVLTGTFAASVLYLCFALGALVGG